MCKPFSGEGSLLFCHVVQALRDHADYLCKYMGSKVNVQEVAEFLQPLERTKGLVELCQRNPSAGSVVAAIYQTYMDCFNAVCCLQNASRLQDFCLDITCLLEAAGVPFSDQSMTVLLF